MEGAVGRKGNIDERFRILRNMFVFIGTPLFPVGRSRFYGVYRVFVHSSLCFTFATTIVGIVVNFQDMDYVMESGRPAFAMFNVLWTVFFMRYQPASSRFAFTNGQFQSHHSVFYCLRQAPTQGCCVCGCKRHVLPSGGTDFEVEVLAH
jgi:hypothetical protein